ncbi:MAG: glucose PTS transporter subunit EIIB [Beutenbergiaceae bacterium]
MREELAVSKAENILAALGGAANVTELEPCITRLRVEVRDPAVVDDDGLRATGAFGVVRSGRVVQVVVGPEADDLAAAMDRLRG